MFVIIFVLLLSSGCSQEVKKNQELVAALEYGVKTLDPSTLRLLNEQYIACNLWEGLVRRSDNNSIEPGMAESWEKSQDGLTYTFYLRKNAFWSDGIPVIAYHFEYAWKRALAPGRNSAVVFMMYFLKNGEKYNKNKATADDVGVKALDKYTLKVTLETPAPYFLEILNYHTYYPVRPDMVEKDPDSWYRKPYTAVSNGPFCLKEWSQNEKIETMKNSYYWDKSNVKLNKLTFLIEQVDDKEIWTKYLNKSIDFGYVFPSEIDVSDEIKSKKNNVFSSNLLSTYYLCFNSRNKLFSDIKVRQAFELALNKNRIVDARKKDEMVATGFIPPGIPDKEPGSDFRSVGGDFMQTKFTCDNIKKAKMLLREAGYDSINDFPVVTILARDIKIVKYIEEQWEQNLGVNVVVDVCQEELYSQKRDTGEFDVLANNWIADFADPINFLGFLSSENGFKGIFPPKYYSLVRESNMVSDNSLRLNYLHEAEKTILNSYTLIPIFYKNCSYYLQRNVKNLLITPLGEIYFRNVYIEREEPVDGENDAN